MRCLLLALPLLALATPALAQPSNMDPEIDKLLACATIFSIKTDELNASGDTGGALEMTNRSNELGERGATRLAEQGLSEADIQNTVMNYILMTSFEYGAEASRFTLDECFTLVE